MRDRRFLRWATTSARLLIGTFVTVAFVLAVVTAITVPWPTLAREPVSLTATPTASESTLVCAGGLLARGREFDDAGRLVTAAAPTVTSGVAAGAPEPSAHVLSTQTVDGLSAPTAVVAEPVDGARTDVAASGSSTVQAEDLSGFAATACRPALMESWLVGGAADTGASDVVLLSNPGTVPATVQLTLYGAAGPIDPAGGTDLVVAPGTQLAVPLAGLGLGEESPVVRVSSTGAPVQAALQASITRTLVPGGVDQVGAIAVPEATQVIPGIAVTRAPGAEGASDAPTVVRILSPDVAATATVTVRAVGANQDTTAPMSVPLTAGVPTEVDLSGLAVGEYTVEVEADSAVVAAVWQTSGFGEGSDFAWYTSAPAIASPSLFAVPNGPDPVLTIANPTEESITATITSVDGSYTAEVTVEAGVSESLSLPPDAVYLLDAGTAGIRASVSLTGKTALAGFPVWGSDAAAQEITVYP